MKVYDTEADAEAEGKSWIEKGHPGETRTFTVHPAFLFVHGVQSRGSPVELFILKTRLEYYHTSYGQTSKRVEIEFLV